MASSSPTHHAHSVYLSIGSNVATSHAVANFQRCLDLIEQRLGKITLVSSIWESPAIGLEGSPNFLNASVHLETGAWITRVWEETKRIEYELGRRRGKGICTVALDIDILLFDTVVAELQPPQVPGVVDNPKPLRLPSSELGSRAHVALPMAEVAPNLVPPGQQSTMEAIAATFKSSNIHHRGDLKLTHKR